MYVKVDGGRGGQHDVDDEEDSEDSDHQSNYAKSGMHAIMITTCTD